MRGIIASINYLIGNALGNTWNMIKAAQNRPVWGFVGGFIVGMFAIPIPFAGALVGGLLGSTLVYFLS